MLLGYLDQEIQRFHTPRAERVDKLFLKLLDLKRLSDVWRWKGMSATQAREKLDKMVGIRGRVAHRVAPSIPVYKSWVKNYLRHVEAIAEKTDHTVMAHLRNLKRRMGPTRKKK